MRLLFDIFFGYLSVIVKDERAAEFFELLRACGIPSHITRRVSGGLKLRIPYSAKRAVGAFASGDGEIYIRECGLPAAARRYKKRVGLFAGVVLCLLLLWQSGKIIWSFSVSGNERLSDKEIITALGQLGCSVGARIDSIDFDLLHNDLALKLDGVAWISVNMKGSLARVEVREVKDPAKIDKYEYCNVIAAEDGQIELVECFDGVRCAEIGAVVRRGELLISGVCEDKNGNVTYRAAAGKVLARVNRNIRVEIAAKREIKVYSGGKKVNYTVNILGKSINISNWGSITSSMYDKIVSEEKLHIFSYELPITVLREEYLGYETELAELDRDSAVSEALVLLRRRRDEILASAELISEELTSYFDGDVYVIECDMVCLTDIAKLAPIELEFGGEAS